ncbi:relaxase MobL [Staphylococcus haemolyticus]|uniref:relaxase MobL n=1 Tax=Staphylococcus haemolyticus TaxID=1283 RepID=UPI003F49E36D
MTLEQSIVIKSQFGSKTSGNYVREYTSREDATESMEIEKYISKYTPRRNATESLKQNVSDETFVEENDRKYTNKQGVMFGNHGLSYSSKMLEECARKIQKATDDGHVPIMNVISFTHEYLQEKGIVNEHTEAPGEDENYKGKVDQLKLRQGITDMMNRMQRDMGFEQAEWGASIHLDTQHVHVHITTVETGTPKSKRMKKIKEKSTEIKPRMKWYSNDKESNYQTKINDNGFMEYYREGNLVAEQERSQKGQPKWFKSEYETGKYIDVEKGKISKKVKSSMRDALNRSLSKTKDIKPFVKEVGDKKRLTKALTLDTVYYNDATVEKLKTLIAALPNNKKMWRAKSNAKSMQRPHEIANEIIDDIWTKNKDAVNLEEFDEAARLYAETRQHDEKFDDKTKNEQIATAYSQLKEESINMLYKDIKERIKDEDKNNTIPKYSIKGASTEALKNEIVKSVHDNKTNKSTNYFEKLVQFEYKQRSYDQRYKKAQFEKQYYKQELDRYDLLEKDSKTSKASKVVRNHFEQEYDYNNKVVDKYAYLKFGENSGVSKERFKEVKGTDLVNMLYDYGKGDDRSVPKSIAQTYAEQTNLRKEAINQTLDYLVETNQIEQYEILRQHRESIRKEADIAEQINEELSIPIPTKQGEATIEKRKTIDTIQGRRLLKQEISHLQKSNRELTKSYEIDTSQKRYIPKKETNTKDDYANNLAQYNEKIRQEWAIQKLQYNQFFYENRKKEEDEMVVSDLQTNIKPKQDYEIEL